MGNRIYLIITLLSFLLSCQKHEWDNPFDPDCPKETFTPSGFQAIQQGNSINLSWRQTNIHISNFVIERRIDNGTWSFFASQQRSLTTFNDGNIIGGKIYSYRIAANAGNNYSNYVTAQATPVLTSTVTTNAITRLLSTSSALGGTISSDGGAPISARGVCWNTSSNPTFSNFKTSDGSGTGTFTSTLKELTPNTKYYARAYATNSAGISYGNEITFKTYYSEVTDIDGNVYPTVQIGTQIWMAENLKTTKYNDGTAIPNVADNTVWAALTTGAYCYYDNDSTTNRATYGSLYNWFAVNTNKLAPTGWHVPTDAEWTTLITYLGGENVAGGKLKEQGTSHWLSPNTGATNETGFTALPGGGRTSDGIFGGIVKLELWWSVPEIDFSNAYSQDMSYYGIFLQEYPHDKNFGLAVRCILGTLNPPTLTTNNITYPTPSSATCGGNITSEGGSTITSKGVCWSTSPNPTITNSKTSDAVGTGTGIFTSNISGLSSNTTYYVRAYATNAIGTSYGAQVSFITLDPNTVADIDGNIYHTVTIGTQVWMVENLKTITFRNGDPIPYYTKTSSRGYCWYNDDIGYKNIYGAIYNIYTAIDNRSICPPGWHIPTVEEWTALVNYLGGESVAGGKLKETGTLHWQSPNTGASNSSGFTALPGGGRDCANNFVNMGSQCNLWTSLTPVSGMVQGTSIFSNSVQFIFGGKYYDCNALYVRCIKD